METKITINKEFQILCPPLQPEERAQLEANIKEEGCRDPLVIWGDILIDGHNRFEICTRNEFEFKTVAKEFESNEAASEWIILNQFGRRNLTPEAARLLRGKLYNSRRKAHRGPEKGCQNDTSKKTAEIVAKETGVSRSTILRDAKFALAVEEQGIEAEVMAGTETRSRTEIVRSAFPEPEAPETTEIQEDGPVRTPDLAPSTAMSWAKNAGLIINNISPTDRMASEAVEYLEGKLGRLKAEIKKNK